MHRLTVGFSDEQLEWIESRADEEDRANAEIVRRAVDAVRTDSNRTDAHRTDAHRIEVDRDEFEALQARVDALEDAIDDDAETPGSGRASSGGEPPGSRAEDGAPDVVKWVRSNQPVSRADILDWVEPQVDIKPESWWKRHGRAELKEHGAEFTRNVGWQFD